VARLDEILGETLRSIYGASQPNYSGGTRGGGGENRRGGGRGTPGYPVPPEMEDDDERRFPFIREVATSHPGMFIGLRVPVATAQLLAIDGGELPESLHVTLYYGKDGNLAQRMRASQIAEMLFAKVGPISARLGGVGRFSASDSSDGKDVIYVSVDSPQLTAFRAALAFALRKIGLEPDGEHGYTPHITIAYLDPGAESPFKRINPMEVRFDSIKCETGEPVNEGETPLVKSPVMDDPGKDPNKGFSDWGNELTEGGKGIAHLEDMRPEEFMQFLAKYKDLPLKGGLEVSEKVDGSARIEFGAENGQLWTKSKNGTPKKSAEEYPDKPMFTALRNAHKALASKPVGKNVPPNTVFVAEVLYTKIPNSIEYGPNVLMIHGVHKGDAVLSDEASKKIATDLIKKVGGSLSDGKDPWKFEYKRVINPQDVMVDVKEEFDSLGEIYDELKKLEPNKLKALGKGPYKAAMERFQTIQKAVKQKLVGQLRKQQSAYGPPGGDVEGLVFRDLETGDLTKLVDKEYFTKLNKFLWHYRELLDRGAKIGDKWEFGMMQKFRNAIADDVLGAPVAKTPGFVKMLQKRGEGLKYPAKANTPEKKADYLLAKYIEDEKLMQGDFVAKFTKSYQQVLKEFQKLRKEWDTKKKQELSFDVKGDDGKTIKKVRMDDLIKQRTDTAFDGMAEFFDGVGQALQKIGGLRGDTTKKVALLKLMMGQNRFGKLAGAEGGAEEPAEESTMNEGPPPIPQAAQKKAGPPPIPANAQAKQPPVVPPPSQAKTQPGGGDKGVTTYEAQEILKKNADKLAKKGINTKVAKPLGQGTRGVAFDVGGNKVLKVTNDAQEAVASFKLKEFNMKHVAKFFDVFRFPEDDPNLGAVYGVLQEKLSPVSGMGKDPGGTDSSGEAAELNMAIIAFNLQPAIYHAGYDWEKVKEACQKKIYEDIDRKYPEWKTDETGTYKKYAVKYAEDMNEKWKVITKKFHIDEMVQELTSKGVKFHDYHAGNIMVRPSGDYVLIDIGYSKVAGGKEPPVLERLVKEIATLGEAVPNRMQAIKAAAQGKKAQKERPMMDVLKEVLPLLVKKGMVKGKPKVLGHGGHGVALDVGAGKVLKITDDALEAKASNHIKGKKLKHVVQIYDVFQLPNSKYYGIYQEKLKPISDYDKKEMDLVTDLLQACKAGEAILSGDYQKVLDQVRANIKDRDVQKLMDSQMRDLQLPEIFKELHDNHIEFLDYHQENLMMRGNDYVVIDLGLSQSPGADPPMLEKIVRQIFNEFSGHEQIKSLGPVPDRQEYVGVDGNLVNHTEDGEVDKYAKNVVEAVADSVGVTIGRFQPFHRGHAEVIRKLANSHTKTIVLVAGNTPDKKNPFSYETRLKMMKASLPDVWRKIEVYKATFGGKNSGYVPGILADVVGKGKSSLKGDTAVEILVGPDRFEQMKQQVARAQEFKASGKEETAFDPDLAVVKALPGVKNDDDTDRISGTRLRIALSKDDKEAVKKMLDPHLVSNVTLFEDVYEDLRRELTKSGGVVKEDIGEFGGETAIHAVIAANADKLKPKGINVPTLHRLGAGQVGVAYDMGNNKVFKVTTSANEAKSCMALKGRNEQHIVKIYDVFRMIDRRNPNKPLYGVIREKLQPLPPQEKAELDDLVDLLRDEQVSGVTPQILDFNTVVQKMRELMTREIRRDLDLPPEAPENPTNKREQRAKTLVDNKMNELVERLKHYQIDQMMQELKSLNIMFADYKGDNVMKRGGQYVLSDPGGKTNSAEPPVLEKIMETIISEIGITMTPGTGPGSTQAGLRAGSSGWSSPQDMYNADDVRASREDDEEFELWSNKLKGVDVAKAIGEMVEKAVTKPAPPKDTTVGKSKKVGASKKKPDLKSVGGSKKVGGSKAPAPMAAGWTKWDPEVELKYPWERGSEVGRGENRVAAQLGFEKSTDKSFDLLDPKTKKRWEVKEVDKPSASIRPGTEGLAAVRQGMVNLFGVMNQLDHFFEHVDEDAYELLRQDFKLPVDDIKDFIAQKGPYIVSGEISKSTLGTSLSEAALMEDAADMKVKDADIYDKPIPEPGEDAKTKMTLQTVLDAIHKFWIESRSARRNVPSKNLKISGNAKAPSKLFAPYVAASQSTGIDLDKIVAAAFDDGKTREQIDADVILFARSFLRNKLFQNPGALKDVFKDATPQKIFSNVDGVILTRQGGYLMIPKEKLNDTLYFDSVTKMNARLKLKKGRF
jgi:cytidyltransferase-like protein